MISLNTFLALSLVVRTLPSGTFAQECHANTTSTHSRLTVSTPDDLSVFNNCTTIIGDIFIDIAFTGPFVLNGVINITGSLSMPDHEESHGMDGIEMLDLLYIESIYLPQTWGLKKLQLPRVEHMEQLYFIQGVEEGWFDLGSLKSADIIAVAGYWTNISFPLLESVSRSLTIVTDPSWSISDRSNPLEIHLPSLREAQWASIRGHLSSLSTPNLEVLGAPEGADPRGMEVQANYTDLSGVYLSSLTRLYGELLLDGHIAGINLNGMQQTNATITIRATSPVEIYSGLQDAGIINLSGELEAINFENVFTAEEMNIESSIISDCPPSVVRLYRELHYTYEPTFCTRNSISHAGRSLNPSSMTHNQTPTASTTPLSIPTWSLPDMSFPTFSASVPDRNTGPNIPTAVIVLLPAITGFSLMIGIWLCFARRKPREVEAEEGRGDSAGVRMEGLNGETRQAEWQQQQQGLGVSEINDAPPPYSRETPK